MRYDTLNDIDTLFHETIAGKTILSMQKIGNTFILRLPIVCLIAKWSLTYLYDAGKRDYPVDLHWAVGKRVNMLTLDVPEELGTPELPENIEIKDSLWEFSFHSQWDNKKRQLELCYRLEIVDGICEADDFDSFTRKVMDIYDSPIMFRQEKL